MPDREAPIVPLQALHREAALALICDQFVADNVLQVSMNISSAEYHRHIQKTVDKAITDGLSIVALDTDSNQLTGCLVAAEFKPEQTDLASLPEKFRPIAALLEELETLYSRYNPAAEGESMLVDLAVVSHQTRGQGVYSALRKTAHTIARQHGFKSILGELSSAATQHFCVEKLGQAVKAEVFFADFTYQGSRPFKEIQNPPSIQLVEASL